MTSVGYCNYEIGVIPNTGEIMDFRGYEITETKEGIIVDGVVDFDPVHIFDCGQCFRWNRQADGSYTGVAAGRVANVQYEGTTLTIKNATIEDYHDFWFGYFDLGRDYSEIKRLVARDEIMEKAICFGSGIRLLKQELPETLISFIISANNRIPRIKNIVEAISQAYGEKIYYDQKVYYSFPSLERLAEVPLDNLQLCRGGYRCKYILGTAKLISEGSIDISCLQKLDRENAMELLLKLPGVGRKVANCVLLYSGTFYNVFPTDVWVKRVMEELYFKKEGKLIEIEQFADSYFGLLSGFAQQYLFYYARENRIGTN
jgi:N-glycosylase/DNA lyase